MAAAIASAAPVGMGRSLRSVTVWRRPGMRPPVTRVVEIRLPQVRDHTLSEEQPRQSFLAYLPRLDLSTVHHKVAPAVVGVPLHDHMEQARRFEACERSGTD